MTQDLTLSVMTSSVNGSHGNHPVAFLCERDAMSELRRR